MKRETKSFVVVGTKRSQNIVMFKAARAPKDGSGHLHELAVRETGTRQWKGAQFYGRFPVRGDVRSGAKSGKFKFV
ncbi:hypothetical protein JTB14_023747 [Gonioctena quinquepunctata]|nr:hypothetical protein JTB14_023747 [Gonioctena quinquepunctata]